MQSTTSVDPASIAALPLEQRIAIAADEIGHRLNVAPSVALRTLAAVYQRASLRVTGPADRRHELSHHLIRSALTARRLAVAIEEAARP